MDFEAFKNTITQEKWRVVYKAIESMSVDDLQKHGPMSSSKFKKLRESLNVLVDDEATSQRKLFAIKDIRKSFRDRTDLDHFLWISGLTGGQEPEKKNMKITQAVIENY